MIKNLGNGGSSGGGTVTAVTGSNGVASSGGNTPNITLATAPANTIKGNNTGSTAVPTDLTVAQVLTELGLSTTVTAVTASAGVVSSGGTTPNLTSDQTFANNFTTAQSITTAPAANTSNDGLILQDITPAAAASQQFSPRLHFIGQGWKTTATAASQTVDWIVEVQPIQGTTNASVNLVFSSQVNGAGFVTALTLNPNTITAAVSVTATQFLPTSASVPTTGIYRPATNTLGFSTATTAVGSFDSSGSFHVLVAGQGLTVKEGSNAKQGTSTLSGGTIVVTNSSVTANSRIFITAQSLGTVAVPSAYGVSARTAGTSFTILASAPTDTSVVAWEIFEPG